MTQVTWTAVDAFAADMLGASDPALDAALESSAAAGLPTINVSPLQGKFLQLLARLQGARTILEIGTLGGYSTIWLARAILPGGSVTTLEVEPRHAEVAQANFVRAGLTDVVELRLGSAHETLPMLVAEQRGPFDLIFIDADKESTAAYFAWALQLSRSGSVILVDNMVRNGAIADGASDDSRVQAARAFVQQLATEKRVSATLVQTVGSKGYDGFVLAVVV
jgi:predicted O-methyltransferase YrrM